MRENKVAVVILAGGKGTRMKHELPKVLVPPNGRPMILKILDEVAKLKSGKPYLVVGYRAGEIKKVVGTRANYILQKEQLGTGHAVAVAKKQLGGKAENILVVYGDSALVRARSLHQLVALRKKYRAAMSLITFMVPNYRGPGRACIHFGRIVRDAKGKFLQQCVEYKDAKPRIRAIREVNSGFYCFEAAWLWENISKIKKHPNGEYYLTDLMGMAVEQGKRVVPWCPKDWREGLGANTSKDIKDLEKLA